MQERPYRSLLFVPASRPDWMERATRFGADAYVLDLEDAVAPGEKAAARRHAAEAIPKLAAEGVGVFVRINDLSTPHWLEDLRAVTVPGLTGVSPPKIHDAGEIQTVAHVLAALEGPAGLDAGSVDIQPLLETAKGIQAGHDVLGASPRVRSYWAGAARDGDVNRELGSQYQLDGRDSLYLRSKLLVDGRAAGARYPLTGTWVDLEDLEGLEAFAAESRMLGYTGLYVIHPSHVEVANRAFTPSPEELDRYRRIVAEMEAAQARGSASIQLDGVMIDIAMEEHARGVLETFAPAGAEEVAS